MHICTGAKVTVIVETNTQKYTYDSHPKALRHCGCQVGKPALSPKKASTRSSICNTPRKTKRAALLPVNIKNLPGKKSKSSTTSTSTSTKTTGKCKVCNVIFESKADKEFRKIKGAKKTTWIGCDQAHCSFWAHASCAGLLLQPKKKVEDHTFLCVEHR